MIDREEREIWQGIFEEVIYPDMAQSAAPTAYTTIWEEEHPPIGQIESFWTGGPLNDGVEYRSPEKFIAEIKERSESGAPIRVLIYRDQNGEPMIHLPDEFIQDLQPFTTKIEIM